ncbi:MAG: hypothetical protein ACI9DO_003600, partial [Reinekea sp.]|uniref:hypothetical protein n=1 Tax=Reinekea sp. TaxID=1970455 RepID=UPI00398947E1
QHALNPYRLSSREAYITVFRRKVKGFLLKNPERCPKGIRELSAASCKLQAASKVKGRVKRLERGCRLLFLNLLNAGSLQLTALF